MSALKYFRRQLEKAQFNLKQQTERNAPEETLRNIRNKIKWYGDAVRALERPKGFNTYDHNGAFKCSVCGFEDWDTLTADIAKYNYCPACGASMDEKRSNFEN